MSGAVAAHAAYNGSGTQGLAVTNKIHDDDGDVMSVFWNKNDTTRQLLYGSSVVEIPSSGSAQVGFGTSRLFTINSDIDCLGDMYLQLTATLPTYTQTAAPISGATGQTIALTPMPFALQSLIERVEIQVGTQIWQTIENQDLRVVNSTELSPDAFSESADLTTPAFLGQSFTAWLVVPSLTKTLGPRLGHFATQTEDGYPMAAAPHQSVKVKVTFVDAFPSPLNWVSGTALTGGSGTASVTIQENVPYSATISWTGGTIPAGTKSGTLTSAGPTGGGITACHLFAKQQIMCNEEREQIKAMPMGLPKRLKMTQNSLTTDIGSSKTKTIELDHFSLYASHLIISGNAGVASGTNNIRLKSAELKLNSSSYSGQLPGVLLNACTSDSLGIFANKFISGDGGNGDSIDVNEFGMGTYVFPLASTAFSGSCVPLNRFDSIRLTLTFTDQPLTGSGTFINVTCVGETTALFKGGAASLAMY